MTYTIRVFDIVDGERKSLGTLTTDDLAMAEEVFASMGPFHDVVQLWSEDEGNPVYRQF